MTKISSRGCHMLKHMIDEEGDASLSYPQLKSYLPQKDKKIIEDIYSDKLGK